MLAPGPRPHAPPRRGFVRLGVTSKTHLPSRSLQPVIVGRAPQHSDLRFLGQLTALVLNVAKARRRVLIRLFDRGL